MGNYWGKISNLEFFLREDLLCSYYRQYRVSNYHISAFFRKFKIHFKTRGEMVETVLSSLILCLLHLKIIVLDTYLVFV